MPELPEVETVRRGLSHLVAGKKIQSINVLWENIVTTDLSIKSWCDLLIGQSIRSVSRRGKYLLFDLGNWILISHLRMEGKFHFYPHSIVLDDFSKHIHVIFSFVDGSQLHYQDVRKFGRFELVEASQLDAFFENKRLGPEPTWETFDIERFISQLARIKQSIKPVLLDQKLVVGLGNIYVDETLFRSKIHPKTPANCLTKEQVISLHRHIIEVLSEAVVVGGSTIRTYLNSSGEAGSFQTQLAVYGRTDKPCIQCQTPIAKIKLSGRGTHFCPNCQKGDVL